MAKVVYTQLWNNGALEYIRRTLKFLYWNIPAFWTCDKMITRDSRLVIVKWNNLASTFGTTICALDALRVFYSQTYRHSVWQRYYSARWDYCETKHCRCTLRNNNRARMDAFRLLVERTIAFCTHNYAADVFSCS